MSLRQVGLVFVFLLAVATPVRAQRSVVELNDAGWKLLQSGDADRAARTFAEALSLRPNDPVLLLGAGAAAHLQGRPDDAMARLKLALQANPKLTEASRLLGEIAYARGDVTAAVRTYEEALKHAPGNTHLANRLKEWKADADTHSRFEEVRYDRFRVMFEGRAEKPLAVDATDRLTAAFWRIGSVLGATPSDPILVVLYTEQQFRDITRAPEWSTGLYDGRIRIPALGATQKPAAFERVLAHELTHAMVTAIAPRGIPAWLHEGLAQHFEGQDVAAARRRLSASGRRIPLAQLERGFTSLSAADAAIAYDESLLAVQPMLARPGFGWTRLLRALGTSTNINVTLDSFALPYADLEREFAR